MKYKKRQFCIFLMIFMIWGTRAYASSKIALDVSQNPVYQNISAQTLIKALKDGREDSHDGNYYAVLGKYKGPGGEDNIFNISSVGDSPGETLQCRMEKGFSQNEYDIKPGDTIWVYGKFTSASWMNRASEIKADNIKKSRVSTAKETVFSLADGTSMDKNTMEKRSIGNGKFNYYIPSYFKEVESELPNVSGYHYKLNNLDGRGAPESLFVFYVDEYLLKDRGDISKTTAVQKAVIENILGGSRILHKYIPFLERDIDKVTVKTDYASFANYSGRFDTSARTGSYYLEFLFLPSEKRQDQRCLLYVYQRENHLDDILLMMRNMEI